jgi:formate-dependent nitrite reductase cytochrome c552 subunit
MKQGKMYGVFLIAVFLVFAGGIYFSPADAEKAQPADKPVKVDACYGCHATVKELHKMGKHAKINCNNCHKGLEKHLGAPGPDTRPETDMSWEACGKCHKEQYDSFMQQTFHRPARDEKSQLTGRSPNPYWDKLMAGHGFTKEHNTTRSHVNMLVDQFAVDRAFGGRFQPKKGWNYIFEKGRVWDILEDRYPDQGKRSSRSRSAANPVCLQCKTGPDQNGHTWVTRSRKQPVSIDVIEYVKDLSMDPLLHLP